MESDGTARSAVETMLRDRADRFSAPIVDVATAVWPIVSRGQENEPTPETP